MVAVDDGEYLQLYMLKGWHSREINKWQDVGFPECEHRMLA